MSKTETEPSKKLTDDSKKSFRKDVRQSTDFTYYNKVQTLSFYVLGTEENRKDSNVVVTNKGNLFCLSRRMIVLASHGFRCNV